MHFRGDGTGRVGWAFAHPDFKEIKLERLMQLKRIRIYNKVSVGKDVKVMKKENQE